MAGFIRQTRPRWLFAPYWIDAHPDHVAATELVDSARLWSKLTKPPYRSLLSGKDFLLFSIHLKLISQPEFVIDISQHWSQKLQALECYHSQFIAGRPTGLPTLLEQIHHEASFWGKAIGTRYGEPFAIREPVGLTNFSPFL